MNTPARPLRVLIVDDKPQVRRDLRRLLALHKALEIAGEAADGLEAVRKAGEIRPDVILLDLEMPVLDGYAAARQIKTRWPGCRVVALSVHSYPSAREKAAQAGVDEFIEKGASLPETLRKIGVPVE
jgi:DNA-binding NarL/FixJ family response regulator